ncbi:tyrosine-type recombinase/integrase [Neorhizobium galegae]|uniref:tyrosine-type recombinase/integrase n=1 Tax=Neorhizobium galegae TaxID=399 RepID=UPI000620F30A|nr:site-specific integrase [Neorhizobium galegae]KAB1125890.1 site-specific integrase [Neorhizobium galegae]MCQ1806166.1 site-specific integrase [Neorhizobium galegae]CDZ55493.1 Prophage DLP12 integrase [Neorhizobium galegae bv. orientalis]
MAIFKHPKSPYWQIEFSIDGHTVRGSSKTKSKKEAEAIERQWREQAKKDAADKKRTGNGPLTLSIAAGRYYTEVAEDQPSARDTYRALERLIKFFGGETRMDAISDPQVISYVATRKKDRRYGKKTFADKRPMTTVSAATINREVATLKRLFMRARRSWKIILPDEPNWRELKLKEAKERVREVQEHEELRFELAARPDYWPWLEFARLTGLRLSETLVRWDEVNFSTAKITTIGKGGKTVTAEISEEVRELLLSLKGQHPEYVFTYLAKRTVKRTEKVRGQRYPLTTAGCSTEWQRMMKRSGITDLRIHDLRHDFATKLLRETGNLKLVSQALNHSDVSVTARYAHVTDNEVRAAMDRVAKSRKKPRNLEQEAA